ncbi:MAG: hypothetical protein AAB571_07350 [Chloroflexota bacterium]
MLQSQRPYFIWNADLSDSDVRAIVAGKRGDLEKIQMIAHIMQNARFDDVWKYIRLDDIVSNWDLVKRMLWPKESKELWQWALQMWGRRVSP